MRKAQTPPPGRCHLLSSILRLEQGICQSYTSGFGRTGLDRRLARPDCQAADRGPAGKQTWWRGKDSNLRNLSVTGLQPVPFNHSGTPPLQPPTRRALELVEGIEPATPRLQGESSTIELHQPAGRVARAAKAPPARRDSDYRRARGTAQAFFGRPRAKNFSLEFDARLEFACRALNAPARFYAWPNLSRTT